MATLNVAFFYEDKELNNKRWFETISFQVASSRQWC
jgi:hypothetical protein